MWQPLSCSQRYLLPDSFEIHSFSTDVIRVRPTMESWSLTAMTHASETCTLSAKSPVTLGTLAKVLLLPPVHVHEVALWGQALQIGHSHTAVTHMRTRGASQARTAQRRVWMMMDGRRLRSVAERCRCQVFQVLHCEAHATTVPSCFLVSEALLY